MDDLLREVRATNSLIRLAFGRQIEESVRNVASRPSHLLVLSLLEGGELPTSELLARAKEAGLARSTLFGILNGLEKAGLVDRPRRGFVGINLTAAPFVQLPRESSPALAAARAGKAEAAAAETSVRPPVRDAAD